MTDRKALHQLIEALPDAQLVAAENSLTYLQEEENRRVLARLAGELPLHGYDHDFYTWTQEQAAALRARHIHDLDIEHLAEEVEALGKRDRRAVESYLEVILLHWLKWVYQSGRRRPSWRTSVRNARSRLARILEDSESLRQAASERLVMIYRRARHGAAEETGLPLATFPEVCPWPVEQVLDEDWWPDGSV